MSDFQSTQVKYKQKKCTIPVDSVFSMTIPLPSVVAVDSELVLEFFTNVLDNIRLLHDRKALTTSLVLKE